MLEAAYNDSAGVTAAFNRNMLAVMNRELDADFDLDAFEHVAFFDREQEWIEMRLRALGPQVVRVEKLGLTVHFANREELRTEISAKFTRSRLEADLRAAGLRLHEFLTDPEDLFALSLVGPLDALRASPARRSPPRRGARRAPRRRAPWTRGSRAPAGSPRPCRPGRRRGRSRRRCTRSGIRSSARMTNAIASSGSGTSCGSPAQLDGVLVAGEREDVDARADAGLERPFAQTRSRIDRVGVIEHAPELRHLSHPR